MRILETFLKDHDADRGVSSSENQMEAKQTLFHKDADKDSSLVYFRDFA